MIYRWAKGYITEQEVSWFSQSYARPHPFRHAHLHHANFQHEEWLGWREQTWGEVPQPLHHWPRAAWRWAGLEWVWQERQTCCKERGHCLDDCSAAATGKRRKTERSIITLHNYTLATKKQRAMKSQKHRLHCNCCSKNAADPVPGGKSPCLWA